MALDPKHLFLTINSKCLFFLINIIEIGLKYTFPGKWVVLTLHWENMRLLPAECAGEVVEEGVIEEELGQVPQLCQSFW